MALGVRVLPEAGQGKRAGGTLEAREVRAWTLANDSKCMREILKEEPVPPVKLSHLCDVTFPPGLEDAGTPPFPGPAAGVGAIGLRRVVVAGSPYASVGSGSVLLGRQQQPGARPARAGEGE